MPTWMVEQGSLPVRLLDLVLVGVLGHSEDFVEILALALPELQLGLLEPPVWLF